MMEIFLVVWAIGVAILFAVAIDDIRQRVKRIEEAVNDIWEDS